MVKVDGSRRLTLRNRRFVRELDPRKTSLEDRQPSISTTQSQTPRLGRMKRYAHAVTPPPSSPPSSTMSTPSQPTPPEPVDEPARNMEVPNTEELIPAQIDGGDDQHDGGEGHQPNDEPDAEATLVENPEARPVRKKKPNMRYPANVFDLNSVRTKSKRTLRGAK